VALTVTDHVATERSIERRGKAEGKIVEGEVNSTSVLLKRWSIALAHGIEQIADERDWTVRIEDPGAPSFDCVNPVAFALIAHGAIAAYRTTATLEERVDSVVGYPWTGTWAMRAIRRDKDTVPRSSGEHPRTKTWRMANIGRCWIVPTPAQFMQALFIFFVARIKVDAILIIVFLFVFFTYIGQLSCIGR
jgi:hypothetical protein